mgnify:FL=1
MNSNLIFYIGAISGAHIIFALITAKELIDHPLIAKASKAFWLIVIFSIPFLGAILFRNLYKFGWGSGRAHSDEPGAGDID